MAEAFAEDLDRLEGRPVDEPDWRARMWRRSYCVALNSIRALEVRMARLQRSNWDAPMIFFYPGADDAY